jgi:hypothetical protein
MVWYGGRKIGRSFFHMCYFVLNNKLLAYYKKNPKDNMVHDIVSIYALNFVVGSVHFVVHLLSKSLFLYSDVVR